MILVHQVRLSVIHSAGGAVIDADQSLSVKVPPVGNLTLLENGPACLYLLGLQCGCETRNFSHRAF